MASLDQVFPDESPLPKIISHYILTTKDCYVDEIYKFYIVYTDNTICYSCTYCWEENVYDAIKNIPFPFIYNGKDAKEHFKGLKTVKTRPRSAHDAWIKRYHEISDSLWLIA